MDDVLNAIVAILAADTQLVGMLNSGAQSIYEERDLTGENFDTKVPLVTITSQGERPLLGPDISTETVTFRIYDQNYGYYRIGQIRRRIKQLLHNQILNVTTPDTRSVLGMLWTWNTPAYYDDNFQADNAGIRFQMTVQDTDFTH